MAKYKLHTMLEDLPVGTIVQVTEEKPSLHFRMIGVRVPIWRVEITDSPEETLLNRAFEFPAYKIQGRADLLIT